MEYIVKYMAIILINLFIIRGDYLIKYLIIGIVILSSYVVIFSLLKSASNFDDEVEKLYNEFNDCNDIID